jgi:hypothetical protein
MESPFGRQCVSGKLYLLCYSRSLLSSLDPPTQTPSARQKLPVNIQHSGTERGARVELCHDLGLLETFEARDATDVSNPWPSSGASELVDLAFKLLVSQNRLEVLCDEIFAMIGAGAHPGSAWWQPVEVVPV